MIQYVLMFNTTAVPAKHKNGCKLVVNVSLSFTDFDFSFSIILSLEYSRGHAVHFWNRLSTVTLIAVFQLVTSLIKNTFLRVWKPFFEIVRMTRISIQELISIIRHGKQTNRQCAVLRGSLSI